MINKKFCALSLAFLLCACGKKSKSQSGGNSNKEQQKEGEHEPNQQGNKVLNGNGKNGLNKPNGGNENGKNDKITPKNENKEIPKKQDKNFPTGLRNPGNSCYLNSTIQQLYNIEPIRNGVLNGNFGTFDDISNELKKENINSDFFWLDCKTLQEKGLNDSQIKILELLRKKQLKIALQEMFKGMSSDSTFFDSGQLLYKLGYQGKQEDASEFLNKILDILVENIVDIKKTINFSHYSQIVRSCNHVSTSEPEPGNILFLEINKDKLEDCLDEYFSTELMNAQNGNQLKCDTCNKLVDGEKKELLVSAPQTFIVALNRFDSQCNKINHKVTFPLNLQIIKKWCAEDLSENIPSYTLTGVIVHSGSLNSGHYWSYVKKGEKWYKCNDATVSEVNMDETLLNSLYGDGKKSDSAYILFYSKA